MKKQSIGDAKFHIQQLNLLLKSLISSHTAEDLRPDSSFAHAFAVQLGMSSKERKFLFGLATNLKKIRPQKPTFNKYIH